MVCRSTTRALRKRFKSSSLRPVVSIWTVSESSGSAATRVSWPGVGSVEASLGRTSGARRSLVSSLLALSMTPTPTSVEVITSRSNVPKSLSALVPSVVVQALSARADTTPSEARVIRVPAECRRPFKKLRMNVP
jgi:hypothetical protein